VLNGISIESCDKLKDGTACRLRKLDKLLEQEEEHLQDHILKSHFNKAVFYEMPATKVRCALVIVKMVQVVG